MKIFSKSKYLDIYGFYLEIDKKTKNTNLSIIDKDNKTLNSTKNRNYLIGHLFHNGTDLDGEYIKLKFTSNKKFTIQNDHYGSLPLFIYESSTKIIFSTSIKNFITIGKIQLKYNPDSFYTHFTFGYIPFSQKSIYQDIFYVKPNVKINFNGKITIEEKKEEIFNDNKIFYKPESEFYKIYLKSIRHLFKQKEITKCLFTITSGKDSLLFGLALKILNLSIDTASFGNYNSNNDLLIGGKRKELLFPNNNHTIYRINKSLIEPKDFITFSTISDGVSSMGAIYGYMFQKKLAELNKTEFIYNDHGEIFRKKISNISQILDSYTTPKDVIQRYFKCKSEYEKNLEKIIEKFKFNNEKLKFEKFYLYDRFIKGQRYKYQTLMHFGAAKITPPLNVYLYRYLIKYNYEILPYNNMLDIFLKKLSYTKNDIYYLNEKEKKMPYNPKDILYDNDDYFCTILSEQRDDLKEIFDIDKISNNIYNKKLLAKDEWFILRLMNLMIFKKEHSISFL